MALSSLTQSPLDRVGDCAEVPISRHPREQRLPSEPYCTVKGCPDSPLPVVSERLRLRLYLWALEATHDVAFDAPGYDVQASSRRLRARVTRIVYAFR